MFQKNNQYSLDNFRILSRSSINLFEDNTIEITKKPNDTTLRQVAPFFYYLILS